MNGHDWRIIGAKKSSSCAYNLLLNALLYRRRKVDFAFESCLSGAAMSRTIISSINDNSTFSPFCSLCADVVASSSSSSVVSVCSSSCVHKLYAFNREVAIQNAPFLFYLIAIAAEFLPLQLRRSRALRLLLNRSCCCYRRRRLLRPAAVTTAISMAAAAASIEAAVAATAKLTTAAAAPTVEDANEAFARR